MKIIDNGLTPEIFIKLRELIGFQNYQKEDVIKALNNCLYTVVIFDNDEAIGMGRVIGDGRISFFIKDVVVRKDYQGKGIGTIIMKAIFRYLNKAACNNAYVGLMSTPNVEGFYERFGFIRRPNSKYGAGMVLYYKGELYD